MVLGERVPCGAFLPYCMVMHLGNENWCYIAGQLLGCWGTAERVLLSCSQKPFVTALLQAGLLQTADGLLVDFHYAAEPLLQNCCWHAAG